MKRVSAQDLSPRWAVGVFRLKPDRAWLEAALLLAACWLSFGLLVPWLGLYADDWPFLYVADQAGPFAIVPFIAWVRPLAGYLFALPVMLFGKQLWLYHVGLLLLRWADALLLRALVRKLWPGEERAAFIAALALAVYPAFKQQPLAEEYYPHFIVLGATLLSMLWMLEAARAGRPYGPKAVLSWVASTGLFFIEYFAGLEALRPLVLWVGLASEEPNLKRRFTRALRAWWPYGAVSLAFLAWRVFIVQFPSYQPTLLGALREHPLRAGLELLKTIARDTWTASVAVWLQPFTTLPAGGERLLGWAALALAGAGIALAGLLAARGSRRPALGLLGLGAAALLAAGVPFWVTGLPVRLEFPWDRTTLAFIVGACLLLAGVAALLPRAAQIGLMALLVGPAIGLHFVNANAFRVEWQTMRGFYWQLSYRAPGLAPGSAVVMDETPFYFHVDKFLSPLLNWTYTPALPEDEAARWGLEMPYAMVDFYKLEDTFTQGLSAAQSFERPYGTLNFHGQTTQLLLVQYTPPGCVHVLEPDETSVGQPFSDAFREAIQLSNTAVIQPTPAQPAQPPAWFGTEPPRGWCYAYESADLAAQQEDWAAAAGFFDSALAAGQTPADPLEWLLVAEAYQHTGDQPALESAIDALLRAAPERAVACEALRQTLGESVPACQP